jgi:hypothetical protein
MQRVSVQDTVKKVGTSTQFKSASPQLLNFNVHLVSPLSEDLLLLELLLEADEELLLEADEELLPSLPLDFPEFETVVTSPNSRALGRIITDSVADVIADTAIVRTR